MVSENEVIGMTNDQYRGIIQLIIKMVKEDVPKEKLLEYLEELIQQTK